MINKQSGVVIDFNQPAQTVAPTLLGSVLSLGPVAVRLTEVEAYEGTDDPASHAWRGPTPRTQVMFGPPGRAYVYFSYGMHWAMNIVCCPEGTAGAVLLRAGEIVRGADVARARRGGVPDVRLARGPGCLAQALGITKAYWGAMIRVNPAGVEDQRSEKNGLALEAGEAPTGIERGPRVGVSRNTEAKLRYWMPGEPSVSQYRASSRRFTS